MTLNETTYKLFRPDLENPTLEDAEPAFAGLNPLGSASSIRCTSRTPSCS
jgi:hypothetical protein